jgi:hypothetical protein
VDKYLYKAGLGLSMDNLNKIIPGFKDYFESNKNTPTGALAQLGDNLLLYLKQYMRSKYDVDANRNDGVPLPSESEESNKAAGESLLNIYANMIIGNIKALELAKKNKEIPYKKTKVMEFQLQMENNRRLPEELQKKVKGFQDFRKTHHDINANEEYKRLTKEANGYLTEGLGMDSVDRTIMHMFKLVHFDKEGNPVSDEDKKNHAWNIKVLETWQGAGENIDEMGKMLNEYLPNATGDIELPPVPGEKLDLNKLDAKEKAEYVTKYRESLDAWCDNLLASPEEVETFLFAAKKGLSIDNLKKKIPGLKKYQADNKAIQGRDTAISFALLYLTNYIIKKDGYDLMNLGWRKYKKEFSTSDSTYAEIVLSNMLQYDAHKDDEIQALDLEQLKKELVPVMQRDKEFLGYRKERPDITRQSFKILQAFQGVSGMKLDEPYASKFKKIKAKFDPYSDGADGLDRTAMTIMKPVVRDEKGKPKNTYYEKNENWNLEWLTAWETDNAKKQEEMIAQQYAHAFDMVKDIPIPTEAQQKSPNSYMAVFHKWIEKKHEDNATGFFFAIHKELSTNTLNKAFKSMPKFLKDNKKYAMLDQLLAILNMYMDPFLASKHQINRALAGQVLTGQAKEVPYYEMNDKNVTAAPMTMKALISEVVKVASQYGQVKDAKEVPFKKQGKTNPKKVKK